MEHTNNTSGNNNLNPEIKEKAEELFNLLKEAEDNWHADELSEAMAEEWGEFIKNSRGYFLLEYARDIARTNSEEAVYSLEEASYYMKDEALKKICDLREYALHISKKWEEIKEGDKDFHSINFSIQEAKKAANEIRILDEMWKYRAMDYRRELQKLKEAS